MILSLTNIDHGPGGFKTNVQVVEVNSYLYL